MSSTSTQSDEAVRRALEALAKPGEAFLSAVAIAAEEARGFLARHVDPEVDRSLRVAAELGAFAASHIDAQRFATLLATSEEPEEVDRTAARKAHAALSAIRKRGRDTFHIRVAPSEDLRDAVERGLSQAGKAFGAARVMDAARSADPGSSVDEAPLGGLSFRHWKRSERRIAPPLVVEVAGGDLHVGGLSDFLDGAQKFVLVVQGLSPPAPLARLISPGILVMQTTDPTALARLGDHDGPGIAALVPDGAACFIHDPAGGAQLAERLTIQHLPEEEPAKPLGSLSAFQQAEDLRQLRSLARDIEEARAVAPVGAVVGAAAPFDSVALGSSEETSRGAAAAPEDQVALLAGWILQQADLSNL